MSSLERLASRTVLVFTLLVAAPSLSAAEGWYLLIPPRSDYDERAEFLRGYKILDTKPLSQWAQQGAYDSASECEAVRNSLLMVEQRTYSKSSEGYLNAESTKKDPIVLNAQRLLTEMNNANVAALMASRCIKSDDQRLRK